MLRMIPLAFLVAASALAQDTNPMVKSQSQVGVEVHASYLEKYFFRGALLDENPTYQTRVKVGMGSWSYTLFYSEPEDSLTGDREFNHTVSYTMLTGRRIRTVGYVNYDYEGLRPDTQELFMRETIQSKWNPTYGLAFDFDTYKGYYLDFSLSRQYLVTRRISLKLGLLVAGAYEMEEETDDEGFVTEAGFFEDDGFSHGRADLELKWQWARNIYLRAGVSHRYAFDDGLAELPGSDRNETFWKSTLSITFP